MSFNRLPSVKTLSYCFGSRAAAARELLEGKRKTTDYESVRELNKTCYCVPDYKQMLMTALNEIGGFHGVEYIRHGSNKKSPSIEYLNAGDTYSCTFMIIDGKRLRIGCWGDIVERGNYE